MSFLFLRCQTSNFILDKYPKSDIMLLFQEGTRKEIDGMKLYVAKNFGRYHYFNSEELRKTYLNSLPEWERKAVLCYEVGGGEE